MIMIWMILIPLCGGVIALAVEKREPSLARVAALFTLLLNALFTCFLLPPRFNDAGNAKPWLMDFTVPWIPSAGIHLHLAMDGLSYVLILLTQFLGIIAVLSSWNEITKKTGFFYFNLLWVLAGIVGVFLAMDMFLFYFFWEMMLIPMFLLILLYGHENRVYASVKFFLFTQISGLFMLLSILGLYFIHGRETGVYTFYYLDLIGTHTQGFMGTLLMLGFLAAFAVKLPAFPVHTWLPDAHTEAPTAGSIILAGLLLKTGAYGMIRFVVPLFPHESSAITPVVMILSVIGILYGAVLALSQTDVKRLVAYTSVSHMGFVMLGVFAWNSLALQGVLIQMICHGLSTGALFYMAGILKDRIHTRDIAEMGGFWATAPRMAVMALFFALASLGLPGLGNFIAELTILLGAYQINKTMAVIASIGLIGAAIYSLWIIQAVFHGPRKLKKPFADLNGIEMTAMAAMALALIWLGLYPQPVFNAAKPAIECTLRLSSTVPPIHETMKSLVSVSAPSIKESAEHGGYGHAAH